eukprot:gene3086-2596_t
MAPYLFNCLYGAALDVWRASLPEDVGIKFTFGVAGRLRQGDNAFPRHHKGKVTDTILADDTTLFTSSWENCKASYRSYSDVVSRFGFTVSLKKTKHLVAGGDDTGGCTLPNVETVSKFKLLGSMVQRDGGFECEVSHRLQQAGRAWEKMKKSCFCNSLINLHTRMSCFLMFVVSRLLCLCEVWSLPRAQEKRLERFYNARLRSLAGFTLIRMRVDNCAVDRSGYVHRVRESCAAYDVHEDNFTRFALNRVKWRSIINGRWRGPRKAGAPRPTPAIVARTDGRFECAACDR